MQSLPPCYGIIPARYASSRFPGKPLVDILGKPMFWHVWSRACRCTQLTSVTLATDDARIADVAKKLNVPVVMTATDHPSGTDRVYEAACALGIPDESVVVNIQGDEPALAPTMLSDLVQPFADIAVQVATLAHEISPQEAAIPDRVKVVLSATGNALYFSRSPIPYDRELTAAPYLAHIGLYAFRMKALRSFTKLPASFLEQQEKLEQLRFLENNIPIHVVRTSGHSVGVDKPNDLLAVIGMLQNEHSSRS